jgi:hypothetical protein
MVTSPRRKGVPEIWRLMNQMRKMALYVQILLSSSEKVIMFHSHLHLRVVCEIRWIKECDLSSGLLLLFGYTRWSHRK